MIRRIALAASVTVSAAPVILAVHAGLTLITAAVPVLSAWLTKLVIDSLMGRASLGTVLAFALALATAGAVAAVLPQLIRYLQAELGRRTGEVIQERLFAAMERFTGLARFEDPRFLDQLRLAQAPGGTVPHSNEVLDGAFGVVRSVFMITGFLGSLFLLNPWMSGLVLVAGVPILVGETALARRRAGMLWQLGPTERQEMFYGSLLSTVEAAKEIRLFGLGGFLRDRMLASRRAANTAKRVLDRRDLFIQAGLGFLAAAVAGAGLVWAAVSARDGWLSVGDIAVFVAAVAGVQAGLASLAGEVARCHQASLLFDHYMSVTTAAPDLPVAVRPLRMSSLRRGIELRDVWFRYAPGRPWILRGIDLTLHHDQSVALVGLNGAGKSTLVKLLCRFYDPTRGAIFWDGVDIREFDIEELRRRIGAVFQDYMDYDMTAAENIALGDLTAIEDRARLQEAAERAGIHRELTELPYGYDTLLSRMFFMETDKENPETGVVLSGGQWQRLALARAFLRGQRDFMILDEPSSGLDARAEHEIHAALDRHRRGRASLLISHRLGATRDADLIVVLSNGRIVEQGDHATLMEAGGPYARLFTTQAAGYQTDREIALTDL
ncbi:ABC transporter ATP-binding protein [Streptosporangium sp. CA-135522]|uniref:ABC transporter ATP-binding protein n=1 Tax=Streptosporangium sp. CA-135522 TaxID=3240072 RepID=UPI003D8D8317